MYFNNNCIPIYVERAMWLSSFHLTNSSETSYMDFSWFYRRMGKYYAEEDNRTLRHQFTLETGEYFFFQVQLIIIVG